MKQKDITYEMVYDAVSSSKTKEEAARKLNRPGQYNVLGKLILKYNINTDHLLSTAQIKNKTIEVKCPVCGKMFLKRPSERKRVCSRSCANTFFRSGPNNGNWKDYAYRSTCFNTHKKECIVCGEKNVVAVHHYDGNKKNNKVNNLIPLCPTHHQYMHSSFKSLINDIVENFRNNIGV